MPKKWKSKKMIPVETIEKWLRDTDWRVRNAAMNACQGRTDIPVETIEKWLRDTDCDVRNAAEKIAAERGMTNLPPYRAVNPPDRVYKKCEGGVIVVAHIPEDAEVRGRVDGKCRADKAEIVEVIGDFCGEPVGISKHDGTVWYYTGDFVEIEDFDKSNAECSTGFHFFCSRALAEAYTG